MWTNLICFSQSSFTKPLTDITVPEHKMGVFETALSNAEGTVTWHFNGQQVDQMQTKRRFNQIALGNFRRLTVKNCLMHENDSQVTCKWGHLETSAKLFLVDCPFIVSDGLKDKKVQSKSDVTLSCHITNNLAPQEIKLAWKKNGTELDLAAQADKYEYVVEGDTHRLVVRAATKKDEAEYEIYLVEPEDFEVTSKCKVIVELGAGEMEEEVEDINVTSEVIEAEEEYEEYERKKKDKPQSAEPEPEEEEEPKWEYALKDQRCKRKQAATFELPCPTARTRVRWLFNGKPICDSLKYATNVAKVNKLTIRDTTLEDSGEYTAVIGEDKVSAKLVVDDWLELVQGLRDQSVQEKDTIKLNVEVSNKTLPGQWFKNGQPIEAGEQYIISNLDGKFELTIPNAKLSDAATYSFQMGDVNTQCDVVVREEPLAILKRLQDQSVLEKSEAVFEVELNKPDVAVEWFYNGEPIARAFPDASAYVTQNVDCKYTLSLPSASLKDQGVYSVQTPNKLKTQALLTVDEQAADFVSELSDKTVKEDETVKFTCQVNKDTVKVKWVLNRERLVEDDNIRLDADGDMRTLVIKKAALTDAGSVSCVLPGNKSSDARLTVIEQPVDVKIQTVEVFEGDDAKLEAVLSKAVAKKDTEWQFKATKVMPSIRYSQDNDRSQITHRLNIKECTVADAGEYTFTARKGVGKVNLVVKALPCKFLKPLADQSPMEHSSATFEATLTKPGHTVKWFVGGVEVAEGDKFKPKQESPVKFSLTIEDCLIPDSAPVTCKVFNDQGDEVCKSEAKLTVTDLPYDVVKGLGNERCMEKDEVRFCCEFNKAVKPEEVRWFKDGIKLVDGEEEGRIAFVHEGTKQWLVISSALMADIGNFEIKVKDVNSVGSLKVKEEEIVFVKKLQEQYWPVEGDTLVLECQTNKDKVNCEWKKYGKPLDMDARMSVERDGKVHRLTITGVKMSDKQNISCVAIKSREEVASTAAKITVKDGPTAIVKGLEDMQVPEGNEALLTVTLNKENEEVAWFRDGAPVSGGLGKRIYSTGPYYYLRISECEPGEHQGQYSFKVKAVETSGKLDVIPKPLAIVKPLKDKVCKEFDQVKFEVELNKPHVGDKLEWLRNGEPIDVAAYADKYELKANGPVYSLVIKNAQFDDEAEYTVQVADAPAVKSTAKLSVTEAPLEFVRTLTDIELKENQPATFECELNKEDEKVTWFKAGKPIEASEHVVIRSAGRVHKLTLKKTEPDSAGKYTVKTRGPSSYACLFIEEIPVEFGKKLENVKVMEGELARFECDTNKADAQVQWFKGAKELRQGDKYKFVSAGAKYALEISDSQLEDQSDYTIVLRGRKCTAHLTVEERAAALLRPLADKTVFEKDEVKLECEFDRAGADATWTKDGVDVKYALGLDRFAKKSSGGVYTLVIPSASLEDGGKFACTVKKTETSCQVVVKEQPVQVVKGLEDQEVVENQAATFTCTLSRPRLDVTWLKNGKELREGDKYQMVKEGKVYKLVLKACQLEDEDKYTIKFQDDCESSANLAVRGNE